MRHPCGSLRRPARSTALSEVADPRFIGTALSAQTAIGFALTVLSIQLVPLLADAVGWQYAFLLLAPGPAFGALAMLRVPGAERLARVRAAAAES